MEEIKLEARQPSSVTETQAVVIRDRLYFHYNPYYILHEFKSFFFFFFTIFPIHITSLMNLSSSLQLFLKEFGESSKLQATNLSAIGRVM